MHRLAIPTTPRYFVTNAGEGCQVVGALIGRGLMMAKDLAAEYPVLVS